MLKICFGIISYLPDEANARKERQDRLDRLFGQLSTLWENIPIMIITQNWADYDVEGRFKNRLIRFDYPKLGILRARQELRKHFLETDFDYIIMFDDDAIIHANPVNLCSDYIELIQKNPEGFCFTNYDGSQLNLCAISRYIYEREPIPNVDPQKSEAFEDKIYSYLLHYKYPDKEFLPPVGLRCTHFKNKEEKAPSTWAHTQLLKWRDLYHNTDIICSYIEKNKKLPPESYWKHVPVQPVKPKPSKPKRTIIDISKWQDDLDR